MKKIVLCLFILFLTIYNVCAIGEKNIVGFWKSVDNKHHFTTSIIVTYMHHSKLYGRVIVSFDEGNGEFIESYMNPSQIAHKVDGQPLLLAIDIFYDLSFDGEKYTKGRILDPRSGKTYKGEAWTTKEGLVLRGKIGPFGMNTLFLVAEEQDFPSFVDIPSYSQFSPYTP